MENYGDPAPIVGQLAAGTYTSIVSIVAPSSAVAGSTVNVEVKIKNLYSDWVHIYCVAVQDSENRFIDWLDAWVAPGATESFYGSFTMPNEDVTINAYSYFEGEDGGLYRDDSKSKTVTLAVAYAGTISKKELEYDSARASIPASNIPQNQRGLVHIWGRNDMTTTQRMGIWWQVKDPDGITVETYSTWEAAPYTSPGSAHEFIGGRFTLGKTGTWKISIQLFMNPAAQVVVDDYYGTLCTVAAVLPEPEFQGFAVADYSKV